MKTKSILIINTAIATASYGFQFGNSVSEIGLVPLQPSYQFYEGRPINLNFGRVVSQELDTSLYLFVKDNNLSLEPHLKCLVDSQLSGIGVFIVDSRYKGGRFFEERLGWPHIADAKSQFKIFREMLPQMPFVIAVVNQDQPYSLNNGGIRTALGLSDDIKLISCIPNNRTNVINVLLELLAILESDDVIRGGEQVLQSLLIQSDQNQ